MNHMVKVKDRQLLSQDNHMCQDILRSNGCVGNRQEWEDATPKQGAGLNGVTRMIEYPFDP